jgi:hypothetical protein
MISGNALRHQMILPEQQYLFDYWRSKCRHGRLPCRSDINPADFQEHLPMISIVDICYKTTNPRFKYRLAGTGFWDLFEAEITGKYIDELPIGDRVGYWNRVMGRIASRGRPSAGVTRPGTPWRGHLAQFWIRLPLSEDGEKVTMILGFDHLVRLSDMPELMGVSEKISA